MNVFIIFGKFLCWIVSIWMRLVRLIEEKDDLRTSKIKYIITKRKGPGGARAPGPDLGLPWYYIHTRVHCLFHICVHAHACKCSWFSNWYSLHAVHQNHLVKSGLKPWVCLTAPSHFKEASTSLILHSNWYGHTAL